MDTKISALPNGNPAAIGDELPINRAGSNFSVTAESVAALGNAQLSGIQHFRQTIPAPRVATLGSNPLKILSGIAGVFLIGLTDALLSIPTGTTPYTLNGADTIEAYYNNGLSPVFNDNTMFGTGLAGFADQVPPTVTSAQVTAIQTENNLGVDVFLSTFNSALSTQVNITGGDGDLTVDFYYTVVPQ